MINPREDKKAVMEIVFEILDGFPVGREFTGWELWELLTARTGHKELPDTGLRYARLYRKDRLYRDVVCISRPESRYRVEERKMIQRELFEEH